MKPVAKIVFDTRYDSSMKLISKSRPQIFQIGADLMEFEPDTMLHPADQLREAQVRVLREAANRAYNEEDVAMINGMADELEKQK